MPDYAARADVVDAAGGEERLTQLADHNHDGKEDVGLVDRAIDAAEGLINSNARKLYEVPFSPVPPMIKTMSADLAVYYLRSWKGCLTESDEMLHEKRCEWLKDLREGKVDPGISPSAKANPDSTGRATARPASKAVSREKLKGFA